MDRFVKGMKRENEADSSIEAVSGAISKSDVRSLVKPPHPNLVLSKSLKVRLRFSSLEVRSKVVQYFKYNAQICTFKKTLLLNVRCHSMFCRASSCSSYDVSRYELEIFK